MKSKVLVFVVWIIFQILRRTWRTQKTPESLTLGELPIAKQPAIFFNWHETILYSLAFFQGHDIRPLVSISKDGDIICDFLSRQGFKYLRGSSSQNGLSGMLGLLRNVKKNCVMVLPDGPQGPRHEIKSGLYFLAKKSGVPLIFWHYEPERYWQIRTWDRVKIPKPFTKIHYYLSKPELLQKFRTEEKGVQFLKQRMSAIVEHCLTNASKKKSSEIF